MTSMGKTGYIHVYTGNGKGKTTAAFGLALRAICAGKTVYVGQFVKSMKYNETRITDLADKITIKQFGNGCMLLRDATSEDVAKAHEGIKKCRQAMDSGKYDVVILDELTIAIHLRLLSIEEALELLTHKRPETEIVITGRYAPQELIDMADLVTEMAEIKHYYTSGVLSRDGIDK